MKTLNIVRIAATILTLFILALTASCNSGPKPNPAPEPRYMPERTLAKYLEITTSVSGLTDETVLVITHVYNIDTGEENINWKRTGNGTSEISIREPEEGNVYTIIAEAEGYDVQPESYKVRITDGDNAVITNNETGEEVSQLYFQFIPPDADSSASQNVSFSQLVSQPNRYNGQVVILEAFYFYAVLESNALADSVELDSSDEGKVVPVGTLIRVKGNISQELQNQLYTQESPSPMNTEYFGKLRITGKFEIDDKDGQYQIDITGVEVLEWTPPPAGTSTPTGNLQVEFKNFSDRPLQGAEVVSIKQPDGQPELSGLTDADGIVAFNDIQQGRYEFTVSLADYTQMDIRVTVTGGRTAGVAFHMAHVGESPDDFVPAPGMGPQYRANVLVQGVTNPWPPILGTEVTLGTPPNMAQITYRDYIETEAGQTRNNMFIAYLPGVDPSDATFDAIEVTLSGTDLPYGITVTQDWQWHGPGTWNKTALKIEISPHVEPGEYTFNINVEINGKDYVTVPCMIEVLE
ncbi:MAG TPA: carboxypeptidase-like regulatory domain-containing protein [Dehalococcoidales bacterium]|nr:carboxypeptidase-like regulatory domain-containing protein [Dehalococcoidales bacterium]